MSRLQGDLPRRARPGFIARPALVQAVAVGQARGLTVLAAPAGYGKTWLAGQVARRWSQAAPRRDGLCVWTLQGSTALQASASRKCASSGCDGGSPMPCSARASASRTSPMSRKPMSPNSSRCAPT